jgi:hypothetical protein
MSDRCRSSERIVFGALRAIILGQRTMKCDPRPNRRRVETRTIRQEAFMRMRNWRRMIGVLGVVTALSIGALPRAGHADGGRAPAPSVFPTYRDPWRTGPAPAPSVFPVYPDPWRNYGRPHPGVRRHPAHQPPDFVAPQPVWVQPYWAWNGYRWVWVPGYWSY